jgi:hypothetical protein
MVKFIRVGRADTLLWFLRRVNIGSVKKVIAREGLIIFGVCGFFLLALILNPTESWPLFILLAYPAYLLVSFIIWAIKTLLDGKGNGIKQNEAVVSVPEAVIQNQVPHDHVKGSNMVKKILWGLLLSMFLMPVNKEWSYAFARLLGAIAGVYTLSFGMSWVLVKVFKNDSILQRAVVVLIAFIGCCAINTSNLRSVGASPAEILEGLFLYSIGLLVAAIYFISKLNDRKALIVFGYVSAISVIVYIIFGTIAACLGMTQDMAVFITFVSILIAIPISVAGVLKGKLLYSDTEWCNRPLTSSPMGAVILWGSVIVLLLIKIAYEIMLGR